jgi:hypothetical protein
MNGHSSSSEWSSKNLMSKLDYYVYFSPQGTISNAVLLAILLDLRISEDLVWLRSSISKDKTS